MKLDWYWYTSYDIISGFLLKDQLGFLFPDAVYAEPLYSAQYPVYTEPIIDQDYSSTYQDNTYAYNPYDYPIGQAYPQTYHSKHFTLD